MPKLQRQDYYDTARDMNWAFSYVKDEDVFPEELSKSFGIAADEWWSWDEPYKLTYREYVHNQAGKDAGIYSIRSTIARSKLYENLDVGWKSAIKAHYGAIPVPEYFASIGEARMVRFGRAAAWRNMATFGTLDECRHGQAQIYFPYCLLDKDPQFDWAHKAMHTNEWGVIAARSLFDDMFTANDAVSTAIQLTFTFETGFTNLQFLGMASDALHVGDIEFGALISSIQTDEARHSQQGEPTLKIMIKNGKKAEAQKMVDQMFWRSWKIFALLTGISMDYYTPLESRTMSFKEFMQDWICRQFMDQFKDLGMDLPWYWEKHFLPELDSFITPITSVSGSGGRPSGGTPMPASPRASASGSNRNTRVGTNALANTGMSSATTCGPAASRRPIPKRSRWSAIAAISRFARRASIRRLGLLRIMVAS